MKTHAPFLFAAAVAAAAATAGAAEFRVTALTPEYILVQGDCSDEESVAFFADERTAGALKVSPDWKQRQELTCRKRAANRLPPK